jgi:hypothetical protein
MLRHIVGQNGELKQTLEFGEWKSVSTDRVVLMPGPKEETQTIQLVFDLYTKKRKSRHQITEILNQRQCFWGKRPWTVQKVRYLLTNPVYKGAYAYSKNHYGRDIPREQWQVREHAFPAIISDKQWARANDLIYQETKPLVDSEMLEDLRRLWKREGRLNSNLINAAKDIPSAVAYARHFGGINGAYKLIGYPLPKDYSYVNAISMMRRMRDALCNDICIQIRAVDGSAERRPGPGVILINGNITLKVTFSTGHLWRSRGSVEMLWTLLFGKRPTADILVIARLLPPEQTIVDYFVVPAVSQLRGALHAKRENNPPFLQLYCFPTLQPLIETFRRYPAKEPA